MSGPFWLVTNLVLFVFVYMCCVWWLIRFPLTKNGFANVPDDIFEGVKKPIPKEAKPTHYFSGYFVLEGYSGEIFIQDCEELGESAYGDKTGQFRKDLPDVYLAAKLKTFVDNEISNSNNSNAQTYPVEWKNHCYSFSNFILEILWPIEEKLEDKPMVVKCSWWKYKFDFMPMVYQLI